MSKFARILPHAVMSWLLSLVMMSVAPPAAAFEMLGLVNYDIDIVNPKPSTYGGTSNGVGYAFFGRLDLGPGQIESGFQFTPTSVNWNESFGSVKVGGAYWMFPILYRFTFLPPFFSLGAGFDYALVSNTTVTLNNAPLVGTTSGYKSHFGAQVSFEAKQDVGENLSLVLDVRYRAGLANALYRNAESMRFNFVMIGLGIQKTLDTPGTPIKE